MGNIVDILLILLVLANLRLLGSSRLAVCIFTVGSQAVLLGAIAVLTQWQAAGRWDSTVTLVAAIAAVSSALKAGVLPWLLRRAVREANVRREVEPIIGFTLSLLCGVAMLGLSVYLGSNLPLPAGMAGASTFLVPVALFTTIVGLFVIVSRNKALTQALGYLAMENGIYALGMALAIHEPLLVEMGILLDVCAGVFVMGIIIYHINRDFDHIDTDRMSVLKD